MEKYPTIDQYVASAMGDQIIRRAKSPLMGFTILAAGLALLALMHNVPMADSLQAFCLTVGVLALGVGVVLAAMCLTKALWHYHYRPSNCRMHLKKLYLDTGDYRRCLDALGAGSTADLARLRPIGTSNAQLQILYSRDHSLALLQAGRLETGHFEPDTPVVQLSGQEFAALKELCK